MTYKKLFACCTQACCKNWLLSTGLFICLQSREDEFVSKESQIRYALGSDSIFPWL